MKRVLFVDDEAPILDALRSRLHRATEWDMVFSVGAAAALQQLEQQAFDVVVTDLRMPQMDGRALLQTVSERWPEAVRIVLSGYSEQQQAMNLVPIAHQFVSKPCESQQLRNRIERALQLRDLLHKPELRAAVGRVRKLPALPRTYARLKAAMAKEDTCVADVAEIVAADTVIAAKVLQMVNSAFFRLAKRITNIDQAVSYLGFATVRNLVLSVEVFSQWTAPAANAVDLEKMQLHVQRVAAAAAALTKGTLLADDAMLAALLHDIGYWVLAQEFPRELALAVQAAKAENIPLHQAEQNIIGASHSEIGAYLLGLWGLPYSVVEAVAHYHSPQRVEHHEFDVLTALAMAHALTDSGPASGFAVLQESDSELERERFKEFPAPFGWDEARQRVAASLKSGEMQS
jgi:HD-like signal output (HDOD) protein/CheY-like chemotaxis protein